MGGVKGLFVVARLKGYRMSSQIARPALGSVTVRPKAAASMAVFDSQGRVLLIERGKGAPRGTWSLPGGHIEPGETAELAACREVFEETSIAVRSHGLVDIQDMIFRDAGGALTAHFLIAVFAGQAIEAGTAPPVPQASDDALDARFVPLDQLEPFRLTTATTAIILRAQAILGAQEILAQAC